MTHGISRSTPAFMLSDVEYTPTQSDMMSPSHFHSSFRTFLISHGSSEQWIPLSRLYPVMSAPGLESLIAISNGFR
jgi:hypothetical protein